MGLWDGSVVKNLPMMKKMQKVPGAGKYPGGGHGNHSSTLTCSIPCTEEPGRLHWVGSIGLQSVGRDWKDSTQHPRTTYNTVLVEMQRSSHSDTQVILFEINFANKLIEEKIFAFNKKTCMFTLKQKNPISTNLLWRYIS